MKPLIKAAISLSLLTLTHLGQAAMLDFESELWQNHEELSSEVSIDELRITSEPTTGLMKAVTNPVAIYPGYDPTNPVEELVIEASTGDKDITVSSITLTDMFEMKQPNLHIRGFSNNTVVKEITVSNFWNSSTSFGRTIDLTGFENLEKLTISNETDSNTSDIYFFLEDISYQVITPYQAPVITNATEIQLSTTRTVTLTLSIFSVEGGEGTFPDDYTLEVLAATSSSNYTVDGLTVNVNDGFYGELKVPVRVSDGRANSNTYNLLIDVIDDGNSSGSDSSSGGANNSGDSGSNGKKSSNGGSLGAISVLLALLGFRRFRRR